MKRIPQGLVVAAISSGGRTGRSHDPDFELLPGRRNLVDQVLDETRMVFQSHRSTGPDSDRGLDAAILAVPASVTEDGIIPVRAMFLKAGNEERWLRS